MPLRNKSNWNPVVLAFLPFTSAVLLFSWVYPPTNVWWDAIDLSIFKAFDSSLRSAGGWQTFWAITNWRLFDITQFVAVFGIAFYWMIADNKQFIKLRIIEYFYFIGLCFFVSFLFHETIFILDYHRPSPTQTIDGAFRISKSVTWLVTKDISNDAFPGDHGFVLFCAMTFFWIKGGRRLGWVSVVLLPPFLLPRLVVGSHWATDILVGSIAMSLVAIGLYFGTPLQSTIPSWSLKKLENRFPAIFSIINGLVNH